MFLAIINDTYTDVREHISAEKSELEIGTYIRKQLQRIARKLCPCCCDNSVASTQSIDSDANAIEDTQSSYISITKLFKEIKVTPSNDDTHRWWSIKIEMLSHGK